MDPVSLGLAAAGVGLAGLALFEPAVKACFEMYGIHQLSMNYGRDYGRIWRTYKLQVARTAWMMTEETRFLMNVPDPQTQDASTVLEALSGIKSDIEVCEKLMKKHGEPLGPRQLSTTQTNGSAKANQASQPTKPRTNASIPTRMSGVKRTLDRLSPRRWGHQKIEETSSSVETTSQRSQATQGSTELETPESSRSGMSSTKISGQALQEAQASFTRDALELQQNARHRTRWIISDKKEFEGAVNDIRRLNNHLQDRLMIKSVTKRPSEGSEFGNIENSLTADSGKESDMLLLHQALQNVNRLQNRIVSLNVSLSNESSEVIDDGYVSLSGNTMVRGTTKHMLQAHKDLQRPKEANTVILEVRQGASDNDNNPLGQGGIPRKLTDLSTDLKDVCPEPGIPLQCLGAIELGHNKPRLYLYQDISRSYHIEGQLTQTLKDQSWRDRNFQADHAKLARSIAEIFSLLVMTFPSSLPKASDLVYYEARKISGNGQAHDPSDDQSGEDMSSSDSGEDEGAINDIQKLSKLSLMSGFGAPVVRDTGALFEAAQQGTPSIIVALGLILYQIGSWKYLKYTMSPRGLEKARADALLHVSDVDEYLPGQFTKAVEACLRWEDDSLNSVSSAKMLQRLVASLRTYETDIRLRF